MKAMKSWMLGMTVALAALVPLQGANAWDHYGGGHWGGGYHGYRGGYGSHWNGGYYGHRGGYYGYRGGYYGGGCWNCGSAGAAVAGLAIGTIVGAAIANAAQPAVVVAPPPVMAPPPPPVCSSVWVNGVLYRNCGGY